MRRWAPLVGLVLVLGACGESVVLDPGGETIVDEEGRELGSGGVIRLRGAPECGADSVAVIEIDHPLGDLDEGETRTYVRDPDSVIEPVRLEAPFDGRSALDRTARFTGYESDRYTIWIGDDADQYIYLVSGSVVEAWPRVIDFGC